MYAFNPPFKFRPLTQIQSEARSNLLARRLFRRVLGQILPWAMHDRPPARGTVDSILNHLQEVRSIMSLTKGLDHNPSTA